MGIITHVAIGNHRGQRRWAATEPGPGNVLRAADEAMEPGSVTNVLCAAGEAGAVTESFLLHKASRQERDVAAREMALISKAMADDDEAADDERRAVLDAARARARSHRQRTGAGGYPDVRVCVKPPAGTVVSLTMRGADTAAVLLRALEARWQLPQCSHRLVWCGKLVPGEARLSDYDASSRQPFRVAPVAATASKSRIQSLARPGSSAASADAAPKGAARAGAVVLSRRLLELSTPRTAAAVPAPPLQQTPAGTGRRPSKKASAARLHELARPSPRRPPPAPLSQEGAHEPDHSGDAGRTAARPAADDGPAVAAAAVSFIHEAVALAEELIAEGRRSEDADCYRDAADAMQQAVTTAQETGAVVKQETEQMIRMLALTKTMMLAASATPA